MSVDDVLYHADRQALVTPNVRAWGHAHARWWRVALAGDNPDEEHRLRMLCNAAWFELNEAERQSAWSWYRSRCGV